MSRNPARHVPPQRRGTALIIVMLMAAVMAMVLAAVIPRTLFHYGLSIHETRYLIAQHMAEGGVEQGIWCLNFGGKELGNNNWSGWETDDADDPTYRRLPPTTAYDADGFPVGEYSVLVYNLKPGAVTPVSGGPGLPFPMPIVSGSAPEVIATAGVPDLTSANSQFRQAKVRMRRTSLFAYALFSDQLLRIGGTADTDSYDSRDGAYGGANRNGGHGDIGSNSNISIFGNADVGGSAAAAGTVSGGGSTNVSGSITSGAPYFNLPSVDADVAAAKIRNDNAGIPPGTDKKGKAYTAYNPSTKSISMSTFTNLRLPGGPSIDQPKIYYFSDIWMSAHSSVTIDGYAVIYTDGDIDLTAWSAFGGSTQNATRLQVYSSYTGSIKLTAQSDFAGAVYAPKATLDFHGNADIFGAFLAKNINMTGTPMFHFDEALWDVGGSGSFVIDSWQEIAPKMELVDAD